MNFTRSLTAIALTSVMLSGCISVRASDIDYETTEQLTLDASDIKKLSVDATAGFLKIKGDESLDEIKVTAELAVQRDHYKLSLDRRGDRAILIADANTDKYSNWFDASPKIDITIHLPARLALDIEDGSGDLWIENVLNGVELTDGSGDIIGKNIAGGVELNDGSGSIELSDINGEITIDDGSGDIELKNVSSNVSIEDGSGSIEVYSVRGKVNLEDGSGDLLVEDAAGHVTIDDGSGDIRVKSLHDGLTLVNTGSGGLSIKDVTGEVNTRD